MGAERIRSLIVTVLLLAVMAAAVVFAGGRRAEAETNRTESIMVTLELFAEGLNRPLSITNAGLGDGRLFVNEQAGVIKIVQPDGTVVSEPFLDISDRVSSAGEGGLLGLAFHPDYPTEEAFFVNYTNFTEDVRRTRISRFAVSNNPNIANPNSEEILLTVTQPVSNHNAGDIHFGPDGYLYIPLGDGGGGGDPDDNAQNIQTLLGKVLRIDVDSGGGSLPAECEGLGSGNYGVPADNPFVVSPSNSCDEIWALGLRNPWRSSFDRQTGDFYIADVGQHAWEEINFQSASSIGGENYGWRCYEGSHEFNAAGCESIDNYDFPIFEYPHADDPCSGSVTGGYVYRGLKYPGLTGRYFLADFCKGNFWDLARSGDQWTATEHGGLKEPFISAFGEDSNGEIYLANLISGNLYLLTGQRTDLSESAYLSLISK